MAGARTRLTREPPVRTGPIRQPARLLTAEQIVKRADGGMRGVVERSVDTAYTVIDEYMERGRAAARLQSERSDGRNGMSTDPRYTTPFGASSDVMAGWAQLMRMWAEGLSAFVPGGPSALNAWMSWFVPTNAAWAGVNRNARVELRVSSKPPTAVTVDLAPGADALVLTAEPVASAGNGQAASPISVVLESSPGLVRVKVNVPDGQPAGSHSFTIRDAYTQHRGTVEVDVLPES